MPLAEHFYEIHGEINDWSDDIKREVSTQMNPGLRPDHIVPSMDTGNTQVATAIHTGVGALSYNELSSVAAREEHLRETRIYMASNTETAGNDNNIGLETIKINIGILDTINKDAIELIAGDVLTSVKVLEDELEIVELEIVASVDKVKLSLDNMHSILCIVFYA